MSFDVYALNYLYIQAELHFYARIFNAYCVILCNGRMIFEGLSNSNRRKNKKKRACTF